METDLVDLLGVWDNSGIMQVDALIGRKISSFSIVKLIGRGGMARVYYAWDERLQRPVALKVIDEGYRNDPTYTDRFIREASFVATWRHPNILQVYFAGEEDGIYFFAMEYIPGRDLGQILQEWKSAGKLLPIPEVLRIANAVASALDYAHHREVIHRDVKPSNVIIADDGRIVLADFGVALNVSRGTVGGSFGSPHYIAPEQAQNSALVVPQSDLYSFGVMLFEMLTGQLPFDDPSPTALVYQHISRVPPSPRSINPALGPGTEQVLLKVLAKNPTERFASGRALVDALTRSLDEDLSATQAGPIPAGKTHPSRARSRPAQIFPAKPAELRQPVYPLNSAADNGTGSMTLPPEAPSVAPRVRRAPARWSLGCLGALASLAIAGFLLAAAFGLIPGIPGVKAWFVTSPSQATPTIAVAGFTSPTLPATPQPSPFLSATETPTATATLTSSPSPTPTSTLTPTPTSTPAVQSLLFYMPNKTDGLVLVNQASLPLALKDLQLRSGSTQIQGKAWDSVTLNKGECILVVTDSRDVNRAGKLSCHLAAEALLWKGSSAFWKDRFDIFYLDHQVGTCSNLQDRKDGCTTNFQIPTPTPTPTATLTLKPYP